jgi:ferritin-like protein
MGKVAREVVEKAGIKVEDLIKKLVAAAGAAAPGCCATTWRLDTLSRCCKS